MEKTGHIEIRITGRKGAVPLTPDNYDIKEIKELLEQAEDLLFPGQKANRPTISYQITEGSVVHRFKTSLQAVIGFSAVLAQLQSVQSTDFLEPATAKAFDSFQQIAVRHDYAFQVTTSVQQSPVLQIDKTTQFYHAEPLWVDAEFYFYGQITNMGGKEKANFHIVTEQGTIRVQTPKEFLEHYDKNPLYKTYGIRATGKQNLQTGEIDTGNLLFQEIIPYEPYYDPKYIQSLREKARDSWKDVNDPDKWLRELRGEV
ncbi:hypothetical protein JNL27_01680 [bacterium]|nr:hypothetical protein [bacterium]